MIGTMRGPRSGSRIRFRSIRVKAIVVETAVREPAANSASKVGLGAGSSMPGTIRFGSGPPSAAVAR